jgi:hypothetical protein
VGDLADDTALKKPILADTLYSAAKRLHLQPVRRLFKRIRPRGRKLPVAATPFITA